MRALLLAFVLVSAAKGQGYPPNYPYLVRLDHSNFEGRSCALLQNTGSFHLEVYGRDDVKVFEGAIPHNELMEIENNLNQNALVNLSQHQIQEPLIRTQHDELQVSVFRGSNWQDLYFRSSDSQQPFKQILQPLVRRLDGLRKQVSRQLSEDEGKNNCLPRGTIALRKRDQPDPARRIESKTTQHILSTGSAPQAQSSPPRASSPSALLRVYSFENKTSSAHESCVLVTVNGAYRFEDRTQRAGKPVNANIVGGQITPEQLQQLKQILDDPAIQGIRHRKPRGSGNIPIMGDMFEVTISRPDGSQRFVLSSSFNRPAISGFYGGDGDLRAADPLRKFLKEHLEAPQAQRLNNEARNDCADAP